MAALIVNADDFGLAPGVNRGIRAARLHGIVRSTSVIVNLPQFAESVRELRAVPDIGIGLHLNLTQGTPVSAARDVPSLVDAQGMLQGDHDDIAARWTLDDVRRELGAQVELFRSTGLPLGHLDSHKHIHRHLKVLEVVIDLARSLHLPVRPLHRDRLDAAGIASPERYVDDVFFAPDGPDRLMERLLALSAGVSEFGCHPGYADDILRQRSVWVEERERELRLFTADAIWTVVRDLRIDLVDYRVFA